VASPWLARISAVRAEILLPVVLVLVAVAAYGGSHAWGDLVSLFVFGVAGWSMKRLGWPRPPLVVGMVIGDIFERYLYISISAFGIGFLTRPAVVGILALAVWALWRPLLEIVRRITTQMRDLGSQPSRMSASAAFTAAVVVVIVVAIALTAGWPAAARPVPLTACGIALTAAVFNLVTELFVTKDDPGAAADRHGRSAGTDLDDPDPSAATARSRRSAVYFLWLAGLLVLVAVTGFIPAIAIFIFVYMNLGFGEPPGRAAACATVTGLACWGLFDRLLAVAWPQSLLGDLFPGLRAALGFI